MAKVHSLMTWDPIWDAHNYKTTVECLGHFHIVNKKFGIDEWVWRDINDIIGVAGKAHFNSSLDLMGAGYIACK